MVKKQKKAEKKAVTPSKPSTTTKTKKKTGASSLGSFTQVKENNPLGKKYTCYSCSVKFYDLNKPEKICPKCGADQNSKPAQKIRSSKLSGKYNDYDIVEEDVATEEEEGIFDPESEEEDIGLEDAIIDEEEN
jgi:uncharacterized protein (TIGR02300 family)